MKSEYTKMIPLIIILVFCVASIFSCAGTNGVQNGAISSNEMKSENKNTGRDNAGTAGKGTGGEISGISSLNGESNTLISEDTPGKHSSGDYKIGPEDLLEIEVFQVDELNTVARVSSSGYIKLPLLDRVKAAGLTESELEKNLSKKLEKYLQEPVVNVFLREYRSQRITVVGAVNQPQVFNVTHQQYLLDMLSAAGGLTDEAGDICYIRRGGENIVVNTKALLYEGRMEMNIPVYSGDVINIPRGGIVFVNGAVNAPGSFNANGSVTLSQAIAMAKGLKYEAVRENIRIYRDTGNNEKKIIEVNYDEIMEKKTSDIILRDKDVVIVPKDGVKGFFAGFVNTFRGIISFGSLTVGAGP